jgi:hypothetical protein
MNLVFFYSKRPCSLYYIVFVFVVCNNKHRGDKTLVRDYSCLEPIDKSTFIGVAWFLIYSYQTAFKRRDTDTVRLLVQSKFGS